MELNILKYIKNSFIFTNI